MHSPTPDAFGHGFLVMLPRLTDGTFPDCYEISETSRIYQHLNHWYATTVRPGFLRWSVLWAASILRHCGRTPATALQIPGSFFLLRDNDPCDGVAWPTIVHLTLRDNPGFRSVPAPFAYFAVQAIDTKFDFISGLFVVEDRALQPGSAGEDFLQHAARFPPQPERCDQWVAWALSILKIPPTATTPGSRFQFCLPPRRNIIPAPLVKDADVLPNPSVVASAERARRSLHSPSSLTDSPGRTSVLLSGPSHNSSDNGPREQTPAPLLRHSRGPSESSSQQSYRRRETAYSDTSDEPVPTTGLNPAFSKEEVKTYRMANALPILKATDMTKDVPEILSFRMSLINAHRSMVTDSVDDRGPVYLDDGSFFVGLLSIKNFETLSGHNFFHSLKSLQKLQWTSFLKQFDSHFLGPTTDEKIRNTWINYRWPNAAIDSPVVALNQLSLLNEHLKEPYDETQLKEYLIHSCHDELLRYQMVAEPFVTAEGGVRKFHSLDITPLQVAEQMSLLQATYNRRSVVTVATAVIVMTITTLADYHLDALTLVKTSVRASSSSPLAPLAALMTVVQTLIAMTVVPTDEMNAVLMNLHVPVLLHAIEPRCPATAASKLATSATTARMLQRLTCSLLRSMTLLCPLLLRINLQTPRQCLCYLISRSPVPTFTFMV
ncbi:hypothetical protein DFJ73DRAFT_757228 [Zopfochytrium polystomum]|nr:hypothetical protein DFJ73DRAFT_757228 [Zopfochytrium polystomum]